MIETTIPEINVSDLMERVRLKAAEIKKIETSGSVEQLRRSELPAVDIVPPQPRLLLPESPPARKERVLAMLEQARERISVAKWIPKPLRGLFRNQDGYNRALLDAVSSLAKANAELANRVEQLTRCLDVEQQWLAEMQERWTGQFTWMESAGRLLDSAFGQLDLFRHQTQEQFDLANGKLDTANSKFEAGFAEIRLRQDTLEDYVRKSALEADRAFRKTVDAVTGELQFLRRQSETLAERLSTLQAESDRDTDLRKAEGSRMQELQSDLARAGEHLRNLQVVHDRNAAELDRVAMGALELRRAIGALDERTVSDGAYFRMELSQHASLLRQGLTARKPKNAQKPSSRNESTDHAPGWLDAFYVSFEDRFRGPRDEIRKRVEIYLPLIRKASAGSSTAPVLDVGCGRGEWLQLLKERKLEARGVDINSAMLAQCRERKLQVVQADAVSHLRSLSANSLGAVTGFHIIEHLELEVLMDLFAETIRVLRPGGIAIFESPNCKNIVVGATNFNIDPTHRNPVFPETAEFMLMSHGFERTQIEYLAPVTGMSLGDSEEFAALNHLLYGPQDYGVIAYKPGGK
jgi:O-antigen chain-terminating methyltransferase